MIPSLEELRKRLVPALASGSALERNPEKSTPPTRSVPLSSSELLVSRQHLPQFGPRSRFLCRLCRGRPELSVILRPKRVRRTSEISRSSLEGWLKHDFVFFGESYLCEGCAKAKGFI
jgi:hypothetical protein